MNHDHVKYPVRKVKFFLQFNLSFRSLYTSQNSVGILSLQLDCVSYRCVCHRICIYVIKDRGSTILFSRNWKQNKEMLSFIHISFINKYFCIYYGKEYSGTSLVSLNLKQLVNICFCFPFIWLWHRNLFPPQNRKIRFVDKVCP